MILVLHGISSLFTTLCVLTGMYRGGMKESGIGRENGMEALEQCQFQLRRLSILLNCLLSVASDSQTKSVIVNTATTEEICKKEDWFAETAQSNTRYG